ncbi:glycosyltransferase [Actinocrispum wychmicini]|uniref:Glycosyltransferase involved in cell wall biosynthesis n=1 Tax=Actinocrispum wychmicini TaxID=1213861 RepID=A0A4R2JMP1_9PSEU|nr:glycosyltransferase [Actinocrispum wychmicini]TCO59892.1 glycosyltransferase involved in cell wall biosynthesis [Actinocrispum wychmicini]
MKHPEVAALMAKLYFDETTAKAVLIRAGYPVHLLPLFLDASSFWTSGIQQMELGLGAPDTLPQLIALTAATFQGNPEIQAMHAKWSGTTPPRRPYTEGPWHTLTLVGADLPNEFLRVVREQVASDAPELLYTANRQCSVSVPDPGRYAARLRQRIHEAIQAYAPGVSLQVTYENHRFRPYLYSELTVYGPDTTPYLLQSVPSVMTPADIADAIVGQYPHDLVSTVVDAETDDGRERLDPGKTLHENKIKDSGKLWVSARASAGGLSPDDGSAPIRILVLATEWFSAHGGLSTVNRRLCQALAVAGAEVYCVVLSASEEEQADATASGVRLIKAKRLFGSSEQEALSRRPRLPDGVVPHLIIGHGRITGRAAAVVADDHFDGVPRLHILHMAPDEVEWLKLDRKNDAGLSAEERMKEERALLRPPAIAAGIGPRLRDLVQAELSPFPNAPEPVHIDPGFDTDRTTPRTPPRGRPVRVLLLGRMEDRLVKGVDVAARALANAVDLLGFDASRVELVLRGVPKDEFTEVRAAVHAWSGKRSLRVTPRSYTVDSEELEHDLLRATLVLMPSRAEGFGLVGMEAIVAATPVLVSDASGLADLVREVVPDEVHRLVVPVTDDEEKDAQRWGAAIAAVLRDPEGAFAVAERVRTAMGKERTWLMAAHAVLRMIG